VTRDSRKEDIILKRKAKVRFLTHDEGGRSAPAKSGYNPHLQIGDIKTSCIVTPVESELSIMQLGTDYDVYMELLLEELYGGCIYSGMQVSLYEGHKLIGIGVFL